MLLQLNSGNRCCLVDEFLSISKRAEFKFCSFLEISKISKHCAKLESKQSNTDLMIAGLTQNLMNKETWGRPHRPVLYKKDI